MTNAALLAIQLLIHPNSRASIFFPRIGEYRIYVIANSSVRRDIELSRDFPLPLTFAHINTRKTSANGKIGKGKNARNYLIHL